MEPIRIEQLNQFKFNDSTTQDENYVTKIYVVVNSDIHNYIEFLRSKINEKIGVKFQSEQKTLEDENEKFYNLKPNYEYYESIINNLKTKYATLKTQYATLKTQCAENLTAEQTKYATLKTQCAENLTAEQTKYSSEEAQCAEKENELAAKKAEYSAKEDELDALKTKCAENLTAEQTKCAENLTAEQTKYSSELSTLKNSEAQYSSELTDKKAEYSAKEDELDAQKQQYASELAALKTKYATELDAQKQQYASELATLKAQCSTKDNEYYKNISNLMAESSASKVLAQRQLNAKESFASELAAQKAQYAEKEDELAAQKAQYAEKEDELAAQKAQYASNKNLAQRKLNAKTKELEKSMLNMSNFKEADCDYKLKLFSDYYKAIIKELIKILLIEPLLSNLIYDQIDYLFKINTNSILDDIRDIIRPRFHFNKSKVENLGILGVINSLEPNYIMEYAGTNQEEYILEVIKKVTKAHKISYESENKFLKNLKITRMKLNDTYYNNKFYNALSINDISSEIIQMYFKAMEAKTVNELKEYLKTQYTETKKNFDSNPNNTNIQSYEKAKYEYRAILTILFLEAYKKNKNNPSNKTIMKQKEEYEKELKSLESDEQELSENKMKTHASYLNEVRISLNKMSIEELKEKVKNIGISEVLINKVFIMNNSTDQSNEQFKKEALIQLILEINPQQTREELDTIKIEELQKQAIIEQILKNTLSDDKERALTKLREELESSNIEPVKEKAKYFGVPFSDSVSKNELINEIIKSKRSNYSLNGALSLNVNSLNVFPEEYVQTERDKRKQLTTNEESVRNQFLKNFENAREGLEQKNYNTIISSALSKVSDISSEIIQKYSKAKQDGTENQLKEDLKKQYTNTNTNTNIHEKAKYKYRAILTILYLEAYEKSENNPNNENIQKQKEEYEKELKNLDSGN